MNNKDTYWTFETARFRVVLTLEPDPYYYNEDEELGEFDLAFNSKVTVYFNNVAIGSDSLFGSVYTDDDIYRFWTAHRDPQPMFRNCTTMRAAHGENVTICHYFPSMVRQAIKQAREFLANASANEEQKAEASGFDTAEAYRTETPEWLQKLHAEDEDTYNDLECPNCGASSPECPHCGTLGLHYCEHEHGSDAKVLNALFEFADSATPDCAAMARSLIAKIVQKNINARTL